MREGRSLRSDRPETPAWPEFPVWCQTGVFGHTGVSGSSDRRLSQRQNASFKCLEDMLMIERWFMGWVGLGLDNVTVESTMHPKIARIKLKTKFWVNSFKNKKFQGATQMAMKIIPRKSTPHKEEGGGLGHHVWVFVIWHREDISWVQGHYSSFKAQLSL